jgi:hypothetical protein
MTGLYCGPASSRIAAVRCALALLLAAAAGTASAQELPRQRQGPYEVALMLPPSGLFAGEEMEVEFRVERVDGADAGAPAPLLWARIRGELDMPSMPSMPRFSEIAHREGIPGVYGVHPVFPHGGEYRLCLTILPPEVQPVGDPRPTTPFTFEFPLIVSDGVSSPKRESAKVKPYLLELTATPRHPAAGEPVDLELRVRHANSLELREVVDFDVQHEKLMHLFLVSSDLARFAHEHPEPEGGGVFRLRYRFPAPGQYRIFADVAPKDAGSQVLSATLSVGEGPVAAASPAVKAPESRVTLSLPEGGVPAGRTVTVTATLTDTSGRAIQDLEPWLGAMGHLLLVHTDAATFAHAHPDDREPGVGQDGRIPFLVRVPKPGRYKGWIQFQRHGKVETLEIELEGVRPRA